MAKKGKRDEPKGKARRKPAGDKQRPEGPVQPPAREPDGDEDSDEPEGRREELCRKPKVRDAFLKIADRVENGYGGQSDRANDTMDYWDCYNSKLTGKQAYNGNSQIFVPIINEAVNARKTRFVNQVFPRSGRNVECITSDEKPYDLMALLEHYVRATKLRTQIVPALTKNGDIEGQYNLYVSWSETERNVVYRTTGKLEIEGEQVEGIDDDAQDIEEEQLVVGCPTVEVLADCDVLILPSTADSVEAALAGGGSATIIRRWSKERIEQAIDDDEIDKEEGDALLTAMADDDKNAGEVNQKKKHVDASGIQGQGDKRHVNVYETWTVLKLEEGMRLCRTYYAGKERVLSIRRNPNWNDRCPLLSAPLDKVAGAFKGISKIAGGVADLQYAANDAVNEGWDSAAYALMPIVMTDPTKNPRVGSMVLNLAAVWETSPRDTQFANFPKLWADAFGLVSAAKNEIFQVLSVSPAIIPQSTGGKNKRNQAEIANEQQVDILSTADVCTNLEDEILTPLLRWFVDLDHQHREDELTVRGYGNMGLRAAMQKVPPIQSDKRYEFRWFGVEAARNAQQIQMQIAALNVVRGIPPQQYQGYELNIVPVIQNMLESAFGPRSTPEIFKDIKSKLTIPPEIENDFLSEGLTLPVHELDEDQEHMKKHLEALKGGDPSGSVREHLMMHRQQMMKKLAMQQQMVQGMQGAPGVPGGGGPGVAGSPRPGAAPGMPRGGQNPPGAVHSDRLQDASAAPRR